MLKNTETLYKNRNDGISQRRWMRQLKLQKKVHNIPYHPVQKESSTTPIRGIDDCSCRQSSNSQILNDYLQCTPPNGKRPDKISNEILSQPCRHNNGYCNGLITFRFKRLLPRCKTFHVVKEPIRPKKLLPSYSFKSVVFGATWSPFNLTLRCWSIYNVTRVKQLH